MSMDASAHFGVAPARLAVVGRRLRAALADRSDAGVAKRVAGGAFLIRVVNAGIAFLSQILLARWMGDSEYGVYVYVWTWVLLLGGLTSFGLASAPQRFIPEYLESGQLDLLRGFLVGSRALAMAFSTALAAAGLAGVWLLGDRLEPWAVAPLYLALICVPMYVLTDVQDGIARSYNWIDVALAPAYFVRPLLILLLLGLLSFERYAPTATTAMAATILATWATSIAQLVMLRRRLPGRTPRGRRAYAPATWMKVSLPIFMVEGFYLLLAYADVLVLSAYRPPEEVGVYYAAVKVMSLVAFVSFSVAAAVAHRFTEYAVSGDRDRLARMVRDAARWTFWPSLAGAAALVALGWPILWLFGESFTAGYGLLPVIAVGLLARAAVGPLERLLNMLGEQNLCALILGGAFALNLALCFALAPRFGMAGVASATSITLVVESVALFTLTRRRLGLGALPWRFDGPTHDLSGDAVTDAVAFPFPVEGERARAAAEPLRFELSGIDALAAHRAAWEDLAERSLERNLFCEADFALAARRLRAARRVRFAVVWDGARMLAAAPVQPRRTLPFVPALASTQWAFFGALGTPMIDRDRATEAVEAMLAGLARRGHPTFQFRFVPERGPTADAIRAAVAVSGGAIMRLEGHERAVMSSGQPAEAYLTASLSAKKLKELRRQLRRLADEAPTDFREARAPEEIAAALERFLELEARGWKGDKGSAMRRHADQLAFARELFARRAEKGCARILELFVGERLVASGLVLTSGRQAWYYKTAYEEAFARCSPGVQLTLELTRRLIEDASIDSVDSTAVANHPMIDHIWRERLALGDWMISTRPGVSTLLSAASLSERLRRELRAGLRHLYRRIKDRNR